VSTALLNTLNERTVRPQQKGRDTEHKKTEGEAERENKGKETKVIQWERQEAEGRRQKGTSSTGQIKKGSLYSSTHILRWTERHN
jgi:hypothetical protein